MTKRLRSVQVVTTLALLWSLLAALAPPMGTVPASAQQDGNAASPRGPRGGPPRGLTAELVVGETRFLFDRVVPVRRQDLTRVASAGETIVYARDEQPPFDAVFVSVPPRDTASLARYLPENVDSPESACLADVAQVGSLDAGEAGIFAFAGFETDLAPDDLQETGSTPDGFPAYAGGEQPLEEIFVDAPDGFQRFIRLDDQGLPAILAGDVPFNGRSFAFSGPSDADVADLARIGCAGPFPLFAAPGGEQEPDEIVALVGGQPLAFAATGEDAEATVVEAADATGEATATQAEDQAADEESSPTDEPAATPTDEEPVAEIEPTVEDEPAEQETTAVAGEQAPGTATPDAGGAAAGTTDELPRELAVGDERYLLDRPVPIDVEDLDEVDRQGGLTVYAPGEDEPFDRLYAANDAAGGQPVRYLPQRQGAADEPCLAETADLGLLDGGESGQFVFAGVEPDLTPDDLQQIATTGDDRAVYAEDAESFTELFVEGDGELLRYVVLDEEGLPAAIGAVFPFGGQTFEFVEEAAGIDQAELARAGCVGPFPALAESDAVDGSLTDLYLSVAGRLFLFRSTDTTAAETAAATATPTGVPTATATATTEPTAEPTSTPEPTATPTPTEEPTSTPEPTATVTPTNTPTPAPTATAEPPTATPVPTATATVPPATASPTTPPTPTEAAETPVPTTEATATATATDPAAIQSVDPVVAPASPTAEAQTTQLLEALPAQLEVQDTTYDLVEAEGRIDIRNLVEVDVVQVQNTTVTVYAEQNVQNVVGPLYATTAGGQLVGRYVPAAGAAPAPPASLPPTVVIEGDTYVFNEIETNINVQNLVQVQVVQVQNTEITVYAEQNVSGRPVRLFGVADDGRVVGQYIEATVVQEAQRTRRPRPFRPAVASTPSANAQPAAAATTVAQPNVCGGAVGSLDANGLPRNLPDRVQLQGVTYSFVRIEEGAPGTLTRIRCVGPFEAMASDREDEARVIFLRVPGTAEGQGVVYRFEVIATVEVELQVTGRPQTVTLRPADDRPATTYSVRATWPRSVYSSTTVILYAEDPTNPAPPSIYAYDVDDDVVGEYAPEGEIREATAEIQEAAEANGLNPDLVLAGLQRYVLVAIWEPSGSTANGWVTFFSTDAAGAGEILLGRDPRLPDLLIYRSAG